MLGGNVKGATIMPEDNFFDMKIEDFEKVTDLNIKGTVCLHWYLVVGK
ncbi:MAG: hypothetical protein R2728_16595 [Chitinophagales bacterium]